MSPKRFLLELPLSLVFATWARLPRPPQRKRAPTRTPALSLLPAAPGLGAGALQQQQQQLPHSSGAARPGPAIASPASRPPDRTAARRGEPSPTPSCLRNRLKSRTAAQPRSPPARPGPGATAAGPGTSPEQVLGGRRGGRGRGPYLLLKPCFSVRLPSGKRGGVSPFSRRGRSPPPESRDGLTGRSAPLPSPARRGRALTRLRGPSITSMDGGGCGHMGAEAAQVAAHRCHRSPHRPVRLAGAAPPASPPRRVVNTAAASARPTPGGGSREPAARARLGQRRRGNGRRSRPRPAPPTAALAPPQRPSSRPRVPCPAEGRERGKL